MTVIARGSGWQASIVHDGRRYRRQFKSEIEAKVWERNQQARIVLGHRPEAVVGGTSMTLGKLLDAVDSAVWRNLRSYETLLGNAKDVVGFLGADRPIDTVDSEAVEAVCSEMRHRGLSNGTINRKVSALSRMLGYAKRMGWLRDVPHMQRQPEFEGRVRWLTRDEEQRVVDELLFRGRGDLASLVRFLAETGLRVGEALRLRWRDCSDEAVTVWETKNGSSRTVPLTSLAREALFAMPLGGERPYGNVKQSPFNHQWDLVRGALGFADDSQFVPHCLRHTCASRLVQAGVEIAVVQKWLGHKTIQMTLRYAHLSPRNLTDAARLLERSAVVTP
jgi:integrase